MNILVTGAKGMVGAALCSNLKSVRDGRDASRPSLMIGEIFEYDIDSSLDELREQCSNADFVFHLAGVNRPEHPSEFETVNVGLTGMLLDELKAAGNTCPIMLSSSVQATLAGRYRDSDYGRSKHRCEQLLFDYGVETGSKVAVYRFPNIMGHSRPNYNSAVSTFCWAIANGEPYIVNDPSIELELLYIDDLVQGMLDLLEGKELRCDFDGICAVPNEEGPFCFVPGSYRVTLGEIVTLLQQFKQQPETLQLTRMPQGSFAKKLFTLYLTYLPKEAFMFPLKMHADLRGSFTELVRVEGCGQVSVNIAKPGVVKGRHWHNSKWELFIVVKGHGLIRERNNRTGETVEFEVSSDAIEAVQMIPGWSHSIENLSETEDLVTVMISNEVFDPQHPDTFEGEV